MATSTSPPTFREALTLTLRLLDTRARRYRNFVIILLAVVFVSFVWATIQFSLVPLLGLLSLPCLCGVFFWLDAMSVNRWRTQILSFWLAGRLDIDDFRYALTSMKRLPKRTMETMLGSLPTREVVGTPVAGTPALREALATTLGCIHSCQAARAIAATAAWTVGAAAVAAAIMERSWGPCVGVVFVLPVWGVATLWKTLRFGHWKREVRGLYRNREGFPLFVEAAARLDWESIKTHQKERILRSLFPNSEVAEQIASPRSAPKPARRC